MRYTAFHYTGEAEVAARLEELVRGADLVVLDNQLLPKGLRSELKRSSATDAVQAELGVQQSAHDVEGPEDVVLEVVGVASSVDA